MLEQKDKRGENVLYAHQDKKEKKDNQEETDKMVFPEIEDHLVEEVYKEKLEKMVHLECLDLKDLWVNLEVLEGPEKRVTEEKMLYISHCQDPQDQGEKEENQAYQELWELKEIWAFLEYLESLVKSVQKAALDYLVLMGYQGEMVLQDLQAFKGRREMDRKEISAYKEIEDPRGRKDIQDQRVQKVWLVNVQFLSH